MDALTLGRRRVAAKELELEHGKVVDTMLCGPNVPRDDLQEINSHNVYIKFISSLDESQQDAMAAWLKESKEGFYYRTAEHETSFENVGVDVANHVDMVCAARGPSDENMYILLRFTTPYGVRISNGAPARA